MADGRPTARPSGRVGLSTPHISPSGATRKRDWLRSEEAADTVRPQPVATYFVGGSRLTVQSAVRPRPWQVNRRRGSISSFSGASRKRLFALLQSINRTRVRHLPLMVTLTYPEVWPSDPKVWKRHLDTFWKAVQRAYPEASAVWKLEFQTRGAPHYHLLVFNLQWLPYRWVAGVWYRVVASLDKRHLRAGTQVKRVRSWRGVMSYASKYLGKVVVGRETDNPGRFWGCLNRAGLPVDAVLLPLTWRAYFRAKRWLLAWEATGHTVITGPQGVAWSQASRRHPPWRKRPPGEWQGLTVLGEPPQLLQLLRCFT